MQGVRKVTVQLTQRAASGVCLAHDLPALPVLRHDTAIVARSYIHHYNVKFKGLHNLFNEHRN